jgi:hypothetical protein
VQQVLPHMLPRAAAAQDHGGGPSIVFVSSVTAFEPPAPIAMYAVRCGGMASLTARKGLAGMHR